MEIVKAWNEILHHIRGQINQTAFETWFTYCYAEKEEETWYIISRNAFGCAWLERNYVSLIKDAIYEVTNEMPELVFTSEDTAGNSSLEKNRVHRVFAEIQRLSTGEWAELYDLLNRDGWIPPRLNEAERVEKSAFEVDDLKNELNKFKS